MPTQEKLVTPALLARRLVRKAQRRVPSFGLTKLRPADVWLLLDAANLSVVREDITPACFPVLRLGASPGSVGRDLVVRASLSEPAVVWLALREVARVWGGHALSAACAADLFATVGAFYHIQEEPSCVRAVNPRWFDRNWNLLLCEAAAIPLARPKSVPASEVYQLGRDARNAANYPLAATLLRRAAKMGEAEADLMTVARSWTALATVEYHQGRFPRARRCSARALRVIERDASLNGQLPLTLHDAFTIEVDAGQYASAVSLAERALVHYDRSSQPFLWFVHDVAWALITLGYHLRALPVLRHLHAMVHSEADRIHALGNLVVASAGAGDVVAWEESRRVLEALLLQAEAEDSVPRGYLSLAQADLVLGRWKTGESAALCAAEEAARRGQVDIELRARTLLEGARRRTSPAAVKPLPESVAARWDELARRLESELAGLRAANDKSCAGSSLQPGTSSLRA